MSQNYCPEFIRYLQESDNFELIVRSCINSIEFGVVDTQFAKSSVSEHAMYSIAAKNCGSAEE